MRLPAANSASILRAGLVAVVVLGLPTTAASLLATEPVVSILTPDSAPLAPAPAPSPGTEEISSPAPAAACSPPPRCGLIPVCRRVPVTITKPHTEYRMETELVCEPGCGGLLGCLLGCLHRATGSDCDRCDNATVRPKKRLVKKVTDQKVASYEYKVFWVCRACAGFGGRCPRDR